MKFYPAGNFPMMRYPEREKELIKMSEQIYGKGSFKRLISFFFIEPWTENVLQIKREYNEENK